MAWIPWAFDPYRITLARECRSMSQKQLAEKIGVVSQQISRWESGEVSPNQKSLEQIGNILEVPASFFFVSSVRNVREEGEHHG